VRFLVDENLSPRFAELLGDAGHDSAHVRDLGLTSASDAVILETARRESRTIISADTDFAALLAHGHLQKPSVVLFRRQRDRRSSVQARLLLDNLDAVAEDLEIGAVVVLTDDRLRVRRLPLLPE
jgi:predicted nuclease of predicted toxin-antitoxin system